MAVKKEQLSPTSVRLTISAESAPMNDAKDKVLKKLGQQLKLPGFRPGKAPLGIVEKNANSSQLQAEFLDEAINRLYVDALASEKLRPVKQPEVNIRKFVPFTTLEFTAEVEVVGDIKLPDYTKIKLARATAEVTAKEIDEVIGNLKVRISEKKNVQRASKDGDQVTIDFSGVDAKTKEPISGADGKAYPLVLGSNTFIPGFEPNLVGLKSGEDKTFTISFPENYGVAALQKRKVSFSVKVTKVEEVVEPKVDDAFATKVGPFKTLKELKDDISKQLLVEKQSQAERNYENELLEKIAEKSEVPIPEALVDEQVEHNEQQLRRNLAYRGQTWPEFLKEEGKTEAEFHDGLRSPAEKQVKAGLVLGEIADKENIVVTPEEFEVRIQLLKEQYKDPAMQAELAKPENRRDIISRIVSEKTIAKLSAYASAK